MSRERVAMRMSGGSVKVVNPYVYLDVRIDDVFAGRLIFELRADVLPKTSENFRLLCRGQSFQGGNKQKLCFQGCAFTRIAPGELCQSGDVVGVAAATAGADGQCIYDGGKYFADEKFIFKHVGRGLLSMANDGPNRNTSRFFITFGKLPLLDGKHVVFGFCCHGMETLALIEKCGEPASGRPLRKVVISQCGELVNPAEYSMPFLKLDRAGKAVGQLSLAARSSSADASAAVGGGGGEGGAGASNGERAEVNPDDRADIDRRARAALEEEEQRRVRRVQRQQQQSGGLTPQPRALQPEQQQQQQQRGDEALSVFTT